MARSTNGLLGVGHVHVSCGWPLFSLDSSSNANEIAGELLAVALVLLKLKAGLVGRNKQFNVFTRSQKRASPGSSIRFTPLHIAANDVRRYRHKGAVVVVPETTGVAQAGQNNSVSCFECLNSPTILESNIQKSYLGVVQDVHDYFHLLTPPAARPIHTPRRLLPATKKKQRERGEHSRTLSSLKHYSCTPQTEQPQLRTICRTPVRFFAPAKQKRTTDHQNGYLDPAPKTSTLPRTSDQG